jgi:hypothetical protein
MNNFIVQTFGVSDMTFAIIVVFWAFLFVIILGDGMEATLTTCISASITAWIIGKIGAILFILLVAVIIGLGAYFLFRDGDQTTTPNFQTTTNPNYNAFFGSTTAHATNQSYKRQPILAPAVLFHGTPSMEAATDILNHNRWLTKPHNPQGVYLSDDFNTASTYAGFKGVVVEVKSFITADMIVDHDRTTLNSDQILAQGFRLIRNKKIYIAPTPMNNKDSYFRIEGLVPIRILDRNQNPISSSLN